METSAKKNLIAIDGIANSDTTDKLGKVGVYPSEVKDPRGSSHLCSTLHEIVHAFRAAHTDEPLELRIRRYPLEAAPKKEQPAIEQLSSSAMYAELRRGLRLLPLYPSLDEGALSQTCQEIKAALVWACSGEE